MKAELFALPGHEWQLFATFTFKTEKVTDRVRIMMFFSALRGFTRKFGVHWRSVLWALRREHGESTGRYHFHALIGGLPPHANTRSVNFMLMDAWEKQGGGMARVFSYNPQLDGVGYLLKACESLLKRADGAQYEAAKFGNADVTLSKSLLRATVNKFA